jgi:hypothetical protein
MPIRLFGGRGSDKGRTCPACEQKIAATATFCPSCYMVFRPEGSADLREHLRGGRVPSDVYLLRKFQAEDPNAGPVVREPGRASISLAATPAEPASPPPVQPPESPVAALDSPPEIPVPVAVPPFEPVAAEGPVQPVVTPGTSPPTPPTPEEASAGPMRPVSTAVPTPTQVTAQPRSQGRAGVDHLVEFKAPLPPPARSIEEVSSLFAWMLDQDPIIPNNLDRLQDIHTVVFRDKPAGHLTYEQHILLQVADDLALHSTRESMDLHLKALAAGYRRAVGAYHSASWRGEHEADSALWQMASMASRLRVEGWIYQTRHGVPPEVAAGGRFRTRQATGD